MTAPACSKNASAEEHPPARSRRWQQDGVHSFLEMVSIEEVRNNQRAVAAQCFAAEEIAELAERRAQTLAGFLALKRALVALFSSVAKGAAFSEKDFILSHSENGAPRVVSVPQLPKSSEQLCAKNVCVSISHTRQWAYGLAVYQETGDA